MFNKPLDLKHTGAVMSYDDVFFHIPTGEAVCPYHTDRTPGKEFRYKTIPDFQPTDEYILLPKITREQLAEIDKSFLAGLPPRQGEAYNKRLAATLHSSDPDQHHVFREDNGLEDAWCAFRENRLREFLSSWCKQQGIPCTYTPPRKLSGQEFLRRVSQVQQEAAQRAEIIRLQKEEYERTGKKPG